MSKRRISDNDENKEHHSLFAEIDNFNISNDSIQIYADKGGIRGNQKYGTGLLKFGTYLTKPTTTALQEFLDATGLQENKFFEMLVDHNENLSKICKRPGNSKLEYDFPYQYRKNSFKNAAIIVFGYDKDDEFRSYATAGFITHKGKEYLHVDLICNCLNKENYCRTDQNNRGPGGQQLLNALIHVLNKAGEFYKGIILKATPQSKDRYLSIGFKEDDIQELNNDLKLMIYDIGIGKGIGNKQLKSKSKGGTKRKTKRKKRKTNRKKRSNKK